MRREILTVLIAAVCCLAFVGCIQIKAFAPPQMREQVVIKSPRIFERNRVVVVTLDGILSSGRGAWALVGGTSTAELREQLERAFADSRVKAIVLRINSPGGEVGASDIMYEQVRRFRQDKGVPIVACITDMGTSGGYYVALASDRIVAGPTALTGSVGVIMQMFNVEGLFDKIGVEPNVIVSGAKKDIGSAFRPMSPDERQVLQHVNDSLFNRFVALMKDARRNMKPEDVALVTDGRVLTAIQAKECNAIDAIGYLEDAVVEAMNLAGIESADVVAYQSEANPQSNLYAAWAANPGAADSMMRAANALTRNSGPRFMYLWTPGLQ